MMGILETASFLLKVLYTNTPNQLAKVFSIYRGYSNFLLNMAFISPSEVENIYIS